MTEPRLAGLVTHSSGCASYFLPIEWEGTLLNCILAQTNGFEASTPGLTNIWVPSSPTVVKKRGSEFFVITSLFSGAKSVSLASEFSNALNKYFEGQLNPQPYIVVGLADVKRQLWNTVK